VSQNLNELLPCYVGITLRPVPSHCLTAHINMGNRGSGLSSFRCWRATSITLLRLITGHEKFRSLGSVLAKSTDLWVLCKSEQLSAYFSYRCKYNYILRVHSWIVCTFESNPCLSKVRVLRKLVHQLFVLLILTLKNNLPALNGSMSGLIDWVIELIHFYILNVCIYVCT